MHVCACTHMSVHVFAHGCVCVFACVGKELGDRVTAVQK